MVQFEAALSLFKTGKISSGMAARWLEIPRVHFLLQACSTGTELLDDSDDDLRRETVNL